MPPVPGDLHRGLLHIQVASVGVEGVSDIRLHAGQIVELGLDHEMLVVLLGDHVYLVINTPPLNTLSHRHFVAMGFKNACHESLEGKTRGPKFQDRPLQVILGYHGAPQLSEPSEYMGVDLFGGDAIVELGLHVVYDLVD